MLTFIPTRHAEERARQRTGMRRHALERMLGRVFYFGLCAEDCSGALHHYLDRVAFHEGAPLVRLYGNHVYVFAGAGEPDARLLVTVMHLPLELRTLARRARQRSLALAA